MTDKLGDAFFRALFHSQLGGIAVADIPTAKIIEINEVLLTILGCERSEIVGKPHAWLDFTPREYQELDLQALSQVREAGYSDPFEKEYQRPDGTRVPVRVSSAIVPDYPDRLIVFVTDISHERAARKREEAVHQRLAIAISAAEQGVWDFDLVTGQMTYSPRAKEIYGLAPDQPVTFELIRDATHPEDLPLTHAQFRRAVDPQVRDRNSYEYRIVRPDGRVCWALAFGEAVFEGLPGDEKAIRYVGTIQDITHRKEAERRQEVLVAELNHRVKNMLAIVQSIAFQTLQGDEVPAEITEAFSGRLRALASAHHLLSEEGWDGASIRDITTAALEPLAFDLHRQFEITGADVLLTPQAAVSLGMALYELATNAAKYGALSTPQGIVTLSWEVLPSPDLQLLIAWKERGGPPVETPARQGFGTRMIKRIMGGDVRLDFAPDGLQCTIKASFQGIVRTGGDSHPVGEAFRLVG